MKTKSNVDDGSIGRKRS